LQQRLTGRQSTESLGDFVHVRDDRLDTVSSTLDLGRQDWHPIRRLQDDASVAGCKIKEIERRRTDISENGHLDVSRIAALTCIAVLKPNGASQGGH